MNRFNYVVTLTLLLSGLTYFNSSIAFAHGDGHQQQKNMPLFTGLNSSAARTVKKFHHALKNSDKKLARSLLADDVVIFEGGGVERSANQYASHHMKADMKFQKELTIKTLEHHVQIVGDLAYSTRRSTMKGKFEGKKINLDIMESIVLKKSNSGWLITHIHWSN